MCTALSTAYTQHLSLLCQCLSSVRVFVYHTLCACVKASAAVCLLLHTEHSLVVFLVPPKGSSSVDPWCVQAKSMFIEFVKKLDLPNRCTLWSCVMSLLVKCEHISILMCTMPGAVTHIVRGEWGEGGACHLRACTCVCATQFGQPHYHLTVSTA